MVHINRSGIYSDHGNKS